MEVPFVDLRLQIASIRREMDAAIARVLDSGRFILGPELEAFERECAEFLGAKHAIGVASGTDALLLALKALNVKPGMYVALPAFTMYATVEAVFHVGAVPLFIDSTPDTYDMDPEALKRIVDGPRGERVAAILPVHLFGQMADMKRIQDVASRRRIPVIEDACQAFGAVRDGLKAGAAGSLACFSFYPTKNLGALGDGGMIATADDRLAERIRLLRDHGQKEKNRHSLVGFTSRLDAIQAAALRVKLKHLNRWNEQRKGIAAEYDRSLRRFAPIIRTPGVAPNSQPIYHQYTIRAHHRDRLRDHLKSRGIETMVYYPLPLYEQEGIRGRGGPPNRCPVAEELCRQVLSLPIFPEMTRNQIRRVVEAIAEFAEPILGERSRPVRKTAGAGKRR